MRRLWQRLRRFLFARRIPRILHGIIGCVCCPHPLNRLADVDFGTVCSCTYRRADDFWLCKSLSLGAPVPFQYMVDLAIVADVLHGCVADLACNYIRSSWQSGVAFLGSRLGVVFSLSVVFGVPSWKPQACVKVMWFEANNVDPQRGSSIDGALKGHLLRRRLHTWTRRGRCCVVAANGTGKVRT